MFLSYLIIWMSLPRILRVIIYNWIIGTILLMIFVDNIDLAWGLFLAGCLGLWVYSNVKKKKVKTPEQIIVKNKLLTLAFWVGVAFSSLFFFTYIHNSAYPENFLFLGLSIFLCFFLTIRNRKPVPLGNPAPTLNCPSPSIDINSTHRITTD